MKKLVIFLLAGFIFYFYGCNEPLVPVVVPVPEPTPMKVELTIYPTGGKTILRGELTDISWRTNANKIVFNGKIESYKGAPIINGNTIIFSGNSISDYVNVRPDFTTTYYITASIGSVVKSDSVTIEVIQPDPIIVERSAMISRAPWTLSQHWAGTDGKWEEYNLSKKDSTNKYKIKPGEGFWIETAQMDTIGSGKCIITIHSLSFDDEIMGYTLTDTTLVTTKFVNNSGTKNLFVRKKETKIPN